MRRRILSLIGIAALGAIAGLFLAPNTGRANRAKAKDKLIHYGHQIAHLFTRLLPSKIRFYSGRVKGLYYWVRDRLVKPPSKLLLDDITITDKVKSAIGRPREMINDSKMNINTEFGIVYLRGVSKNPRQKQRAQRLAQSVDGVIDVVNELKVAA